MTKGPKKTGYTYESIDGCAQLITCKEERVNGNCRADVCRVYREGACQNISGEGNIILNPKVLNSFRKKVQL